MAEKEIQKKNENELTLLLESKRKDLWNFRFGVSGSKVRNVKEGKLLRREIARIMTALTALKKPVKAS